MGTLTVTCPVCEKRSIEDRGSLPQDGSICWRQNVVRPALGSQAIFNSNWKNELEDLAVSIVGAATSLSGGRVRIHLGCTEPRYKPDMNMRELLQVTAAAFIVNGRPCDLVFKD